MTLAHYFPKTSWLCFKKVHQFLDFTKKNVIQKLNSLFNNINLEFKKNSQVPLLLEKGFFLVKL